MKKYILGVISGIVLSVPLYAFADNGLEQVTAYLRKDLPILLDGQKLELKNPPLIYDGSTYLPLKEAAAVLGKEAKWNEQTQSVELSSTTSNPQQGQVTPPAQQTSKDDKYAGKVFVSGADLGVVFNGPKRSSLSLVDKSEKQNDVFWDGTVMYYSSDFLLGLGIEMKELESLQKYKVSLNGVERF